MTADKDCVQFSIEVNALLSKDFIPLFFPKCCLGIRRWSHVLMVTGEGLLACILGLRALLASADLSSLYQVPEYSVLASNMLCFVLSAASGAQRRKGHGGTSSRRPQNLLSLSVMRPLASVASLPWSQASCIPLIFLVIRDIRIYRIPWYPRGPWETRVGFSPPV